MSCGTELSKCLPRYVSYLAYRDWILRLSELKLILSVNFFVCDLKPEYWSDLGAVFAKVLYFLVVNAMPSFSRFLGGRFSGTS